jgi:aspartate-semialdehyde dehydrogenase
MTVQPLEPESRLPDRLFRPARRRGTDIEVAFAAAGYGVIQQRSLTAWLRRALVIPEVKPISGEDSGAAAQGGWDRGYIVSTQLLIIGLGVALMPLHDAFTVRRVVVTSMQSVSGAGYPGVPSWT